VIIVNIELHEIPIRDVFYKYIDNSEAGGIVGYGGKLNIRPPYQREFVYDDKKRNAVIETIRKGYPLNSIYWIKNDDGTFEIMDGQQRTVSFCRYVNCEFSVNCQYFHTLQLSEQQQILDYKLMVYFCEGGDREKLDWFKIINIAGEKLTDQELRNAVYTGPWLASAKSIFSKSNCAAYLLSKDYVTGSPIRQDILQTAIDWASKGNIEEYMSKHQLDPNANELWTYFRNAIEWVELTFISRPVRKEMKGLDWGDLYDKFGGKLHETAELEREIKILMADDDVTNKRGVYPYVLTRNEKYLNIRAFTESQKRTVYERQSGICVECEQLFDLSEMEAHHITPWSRGGKTAIENCQMLCRECNRRKSDK